MSNIPNRYQGIEFPDYVFQEYPKWIGDKLVNSRAEEDALIQKEEKKSNETPPDPKKPWSPKS